MTAEQLAKLRNMRANGWPTRRIARELGCTLEELRFAERALRPKWKKCPPRCMSDADCRAAYLARMRGARWGDLSGDVADTTFHYNVKMWAQENGMAWPPPPSWAREAYDMVASGAIWREVAETFGLRSSQNAFNRVQRAALKHGWPWPVPRG